MGGGLLTLAGLVYCVASGSGIREIFRFDPAEGWWFLNLGRNLVYPVEAFYHVLFLACILMVVRERYAAALGAAALLSLNHPFSGVQLLLVLLAWAAVERAFIRNARVPSYFLWGVGVALGAHLGYYMGYLNTFPEHRALFEQWKGTNWLLQADSFVPAYALVAATAFWRARRSDLAGRVFQAPRNRLFLVWFLVSFGLANHEFAIDSIQPVHFTRGYIWIPLFLLGAPALISLFRWLPARFGEPDVSRLSRCWRCC